MDPYLESPIRWVGFHAWLNTVIATALNRVLPDGYAAELDQHVWLSRDDEDAPRSIRPDVFLTTSRPERRLVEDSGQGLLTAAPATLVMTMPQPKTNKRPFIKIQANDGSGIVTVLEPLSASNKRSGPGRRLYLSKRNEYPAARINVVEIDLLSAGLRRHVGKPQPPRTDYYVQVRDIQQPNRIQVWAFGLRDRLPIVPIPLKPKINPVLLDLQSCVDEVYESGRYGGKLDYTKPPDPPMNEADRLWAEQLISRCIPTEQPS